MVNGIYFKLCNQSKLYSNFNFTLTEIGFKPIIDICMCFQIELKLNVSEKFQHTYVYIICLKNIVNFIIIDGIE